jgi:rare lipoprotein A
MVRSAFVIAALVLFASPAFAKMDSQSEQGIASTYGRKFVGRTTASGALLDRYSLTAAHRRLPFGTRVEVLNKHNGRTIIVTVNDRGPHLKGRIIDLSPAAAEALGMRGEGLVPVEIHIALRK